MSGTPILAMSNLQNLVSFDEETTKLQSFQDFQEYFASSPHELRSPARMNSR